MSVRIRLARVGAKKKPSYRIVVADRESPRDGRFVERLGSYDPKKDPPAVRVAEERVIAWLRKGAVPSETVARLLKRQGVFEKMRSAAAK